MENLYNKMLEKQELIKKDRYEKQKQYAREYYWKNREYVLERNRMKKYERSEYFKQWYEKNKKNKKIKQQFKPKINNNKIYKPEDFILFK
jgi:hypothetical protein